MRFISRPLQATVLIALAASLPANAADLLIKNATVFDGTGRDPITQASIVIENGVISRVEVGDSGTSADKIIDAGGKTVMPGMINGHFHLFFDFFSNPPKNMAGNDVQAKAYIRDTLPTILNGHLEHGITSLFSPIDFWPHIFDVKHKVASGEISGPRIFVGGPIVMRAGSHYACAAETGAAKTWCDDRMALHFESPDQARAAVKRLAADGADVIVFDAITNQPELDNASLKAMVDEAHAHKLHIASHNTNARDAKALVEAGVDAFVHPPGVTRDTDGSLLSIIGQRHLPIEITLGFYQRLIAQGHASEKDVQDYDTLLNNVRVMLNAGATPVFASDMPGLPPEQVVPTITGVMSGVGIDNKTILLSATRNAARGLLGRKDLGTLEPGQIADLIMVNGNPLTDLSALQNVTLVIKDGKIVSDKRATSP